MAESKQNPAHSWTQLQRLGVNPSVSSYDEYERLCARGAFSAEKFVSEYRPNLFENETSLIVHRIMFGAVHPWAGRFREGGELAIIAGYPAADAWRIECELDLLRIQVERFIDFLSCPNVDALQASVAVCAFHHIRFERIHPFRDGNGRVGRVILVAALSRSLQQSVTIDWSASKQRYYSALSAGNKGDLGPFVNLCLDSSGLPLLDGRLSAPFRVAPRMFEENSLPSIEDDFRWSIRS